MKERIEVIDYKYKMVGWTFALFFVLSLLAPISGSDYIYAVSPNNFLDLWNSVKSTFDGTMIGSAIVLFLSSNKLLFSVVFALFMALFVYICNSFMGTITKKYYYMLPLFFLLFVNYLLFSQSYFSVNYAVQYTIPSILIFYYLYQFYHNPKLKFSFFEIVLLLLLHLIVPTLSFFSGTILILADLFLLFYSKKAFKKFSIWYFVFLLVGGISYAVVITKSTILKEMMALTFSEITKNFSFTISNFLSYTFTRNVVLQVAMLIPINMYLYQKVKDRTYTRLIMVLFNLIPLFSIICQFYLLVPVNIHLIISQYSGIFSCDRWYFTFYWIFYFYLFLRSISYFVSEKKLKSFLLFFVFSGFLFQLITLVKPLWLDTYSTYYVLGMIFVSIIVIVKMDIPIRFMILPKLFYLSIFYFLMMFVMISYYDGTRVSYIKEQLQENSKVIVVKALPIRYIYGYNPIYYEDMELFRKYYNIPKDKEISVKYVGVFEKIEKNIKK